MTGAHPATVARGAREASGTPEPRTRAPGGGRKKLSATDPELGPALMALVEPESRGIRVAAAVDVLRPGPWRAR